MSSASHDPAVDVRLADLRARIQRLEVANDRLTRRIERGERQRVFFAVAGVVVSSVAIAALILVVYVLAGRNDSRSYYNEQIQKLDMRTTAQIRSLACLVPPGNDFTDALRIQYQCGPYHRPTKEKR